MSYELTAENIAGEYRHNDPRQPFLEAEIKALVAQERLLAVKELTTGETVIERTMLILKWINELRYDYHLEDNTAAVEALDQLRLIIERNTKAY